MDRLDDRVRGRRQEAIDQMRCRDRFGLGATIAFELGPGVSEAVLIGSSQLPHVVALPLNRRLNLVADFENLLLGLAPSPRLASGYRKSLANDEQIAFSIQINVEHVLPPSQLNVIASEHKRRLQKCNTEPPFSASHPRPSAPTIADGLQLVFCE
jgi:hypothetical protein